jgi:hypothetical protein
MTGVSRVGSYPSQAGPDVVWVETEAGRFKVLRHKVDQSVLIVPPASRAFSAALKSDLSLGGVDTDLIAKEKPEMMAVAKAWADPRGCKVSEVYRLNPSAWEAVIACP